MCLVTGFPAVPPARRGISIDKLKTRFGFEGISEGDALSLGRPSLPVVGQRIETHGLLHGCSRRRRRVGGRLGTGRRGTCRGLVLVLVLPLERVECRDRPTELVRAPGGGHGGRSGSRRTRFGRRTTIEEDGNVRYLQAGHAVLHFVFLEGHVGAELPQHRDCALALRKWHRLVVLPMADQSSQALIRWCHGGRPGAEEVREQHDATEGCIWEAQRSSRCRAATLGEAADQDALRLHTPGDLAPNHGLEVGDGGLGHIVVDDPLAVRRQEPGGDSLALQRLEGRLGQQHTQVAVPGHQWPQHVRHIAGTLISKAMQKDQAPGCS
mmetsp:Transcript_17539/g.61318  ORF Transcript_17539/g.61318 Transcript_17539/m.61318 type:complete len:324 (+) Transcript_17539:150-1121(+)